MPDLRPNLSLLTALVAALPAGLGLAFAPPAATAQTAERAPRHVALLIGVGDYQHFRRFGPPGRSDLRGPPHDVERMRVALRRYDFDGENVRIVLGRQASRRGIEDAFGWLTERATRPDDAVVIYYSGHGTWAEDRDGDEAEDTPGDTRDEALVPWDAEDIHDPDQLVLDDQIEGWLSELSSRGVTNVTVVIDACYSGTATRGPLSLSSRGPLEGSGEGASLFVPGRLGHTLLTAASPTQVAIEKSLGSNKLVHGVFTFHLTRALEGAAPAARYDEVMRQVQRDVAGEKPRFQTPQLLGETGARLFRVKGDVARRAFALVRGVGDGTYSLDVGAVHGVRASALYEVFGPEERDFAGDPLALMRIDSVSMHRSTGEVTEGASDLPEGARAILARVPPEVDRPTEIAVHVTEAAGDAGALIEDLPFVRVADAVEADAFLDRTDEAYEILVDDSELPPVDREALYAIPNGSEDGVGFQGTEEGLCRPLSRVFAVRSFQAVENPQPPQGLDIQLQFVEAGTSPRDRTSDADTLRVGRTYDFYARVVAPEGSRLFFSAAIEGYVSTPVVLYPPADRANQLFPVNQWVRLFQGARAEEPAGSERIKAVAASFQYDFHSLARSVDGLCELAEGIRGIGADGDGEPEPVVGWKDVEHTVVIE